MVNKARKLKKAKGILPDISPLKARKLSEESKTKVIDFYNDDEVSRMCPGKKDFVSVKNSEGKRVHVQKRLLLANLRELYLYYKEKSSGEHVEFSKFCELRPRWCITVGAKGMHSVCVCEYHQNVKLLLDSLPGPKLDHKSLMAKLVCDVSERNCMLHRCEKCPGSPSVCLFGTFNRGGRWTNFQAMDAYRWHTTYHKTGTCVWPFGGDRFAN